MKFKLHALFLVLVMILGINLPLLRAQEAAKDSDDTIEAEDSSADLTVSPQRGHPWEYDAGPEKNSEWLNIFSNLPNYRAIGRAVIGQERFRWHWGPVFYRGRLGKNEVKVLVIGQEGAQDEALAKKTFTGGTGQHLQAFLNSIGINRSYIFVNTFIYSIRGQYQDQKLPNAVEGDLWLAQDPQSPIVQLRNRLLNHILDNNSDSLKLVVAVGGGAKDTLMTWVKSRGGKCRDTIESCDGSVIKNDVVLASVLHPGMLGQFDRGTPEFNNAADLLQKSFQRAANRVAENLSRNENWLPLDEEASRQQVVSRTGNDNSSFVTFEKPYKYRSAPVPFRDFAFGTNWRLGSKSTVSNRTTDQRSIKIFSIKGKYNDHAKWRTPDGSSFESSGYIAQDGDLAYESSRVDANAYDPGPSEEWAKLLMGGVPGYEWPDFNSLGVTEDKSFGTGPIYRGRLDNAKVLIVADQESQDDMFTGRALSGDGGQKVQHLLSTLGIVHNYVIIRTLPVDTLDLTAKQVREISNNSQVVKVRNKILSDVLAKNDIQLVLTFGPNAQDAARKVDTKQAFVLNLKAADEKEAIEDWNFAIQTLSEKVKGELRYTSDFTPKLNFRYNAKKFDDTRLEINRYDLPFATPRWFGTSGSLGSRALDNTELYQMTMPQWANDLRAPKLSESETASLKTGGWLK